MFYGLVVPVERAGDADKLETESLCLGPATEIDMVGVLDGVENDERAFATSLWTAVCPNSISVASGTHKYKEWVTSVDGLYRSKFHFSQVGTVLFQLCYSLKGNLLKKSLLNDLIRNYGSRPRGVILKFASFKLPAPCIYGLLAS